MQTRVPTQYTTWYHEVDQFFNDECELIKFTMDKRRYLFTWYLHLARMRTSSCAHKVQRTQCSNLLFYIHTNRWCVTVLSCTEYSVDRLRLTTNVIHSMHQLAYLWKRKSSFKQTILNNNDEVFGIFPFVVVVVGLLFTNKIFSYYQILNVLLFYAFSYCF